MTSMKSFGIIFLGLFLSLWGEQKALESPCLPPLPKTDSLNFRVLSAQGISGILFGGFRGMIAGITWMYIDSLWHQARFYKLPPLYEFMTTLQPDFIDGWIMGGWHMAYNMSLELPKVKNLSPALRQKLELQWVYKGIQFLKSGAAMNPKNASLPFEIGWTYYHRLNNYKDAVPWFDNSAALNPEDGLPLRLSAYATEKSGSPQTALKKWLELKQHPSYTLTYSKNIIDRNILRLQSLTGK